jgi:hypothetical protein
MKREGQATLPATGPAQTDILRLWTYIKAEYVPDAIIRLTPMQDAEKRPMLLLELVSPGAGGSPAEQWEDVWASKSFANPLHLISTNQLFDLLIVGQRLMDQFFSYGEQYAPTRRRV